MATLHLANVPPSVYSLLRERAERRGRTIEEEAVACLDSAVSLRPRSREDVGRVLEELDRFRSTLGSLYVTEEQLQQMKREGRP